MKNFIVHLFDSRSRAVEAHLVMLCLGVGAFVGLSIYHVVILRHSFEPDLYGQGLGFLLSGGGVAAVGQGLQRKAEAQHAAAPDGECDESTH